MPQVQAQQLHDLITQEDHDIVDEKLLKEVHADLDSYMHTQTDANPSLQNDDSPSSSKKVLELDVHVKPRDPIYHNRLALYSDESAEPIDPEDDNSSSKHQGFLEKNLSDFFDI